MGVCRKLQALLAFIFYKGVFVIEEIAWDNVDPILNNVIDDFMETMKKHKEDDSFNVEESYNILRMLLKRMDKIVVERSTR